MANKDRKTLDDLNIDINILKWKICSEIIRYMSDETRVELTELTRLDTKDGTKDFIAVLAVIGKDAVNPHFVYADHYAPPGSEATVEYDDLTIENLIRILERMP